MVLGERVGHFITLLGDVGRRGPRRDKNPCGSEEDAADWSAAAIDRREESALSTVRHQLYSRYEQAWHWFRPPRRARAADSHRPGNSCPRAVGWLPFATAVQIHNILGFLLLANAFLGVFRHYRHLRACPPVPPKPQEFGARAVRQMVLSPAASSATKTQPMAKVQEQRLAPLQQITYLIILNILLPLRVTAGLLIWGARPGRRRSRRWAGCPSSA